MKSTTPLEGDLQLRADVPSRSMRRQARPAAGGKSRARTFRAAEIDHSCLNSRAPAQLTSAPSDLKQDNYRKRITMLEHQLKTSGSKVQTGLYTGLP